MAIDRRDFLKFAIGGAVGTVFTPMPWVSMNEVAKWSQRWALIPEKGGTATLTSTCKLCPGGCGIRVRLIEKARAIKIDGNPNHPVNRGGLCPLGLAGLQYLYHDDIRIKTPLRRDGARGLGEWTPITWEEALYQITSRLKDLRGKGLTHTVGLIDGEGTGSQARLAAEFLKAYGSPNYVRPFQPGDLEGILTKTMVGVRVGLSYDLPRTQYILSFGCALLDGWGNPLWIAQAYQQWRQEVRQKRVKLVQIDTMATTTASLADEWIAINPGTEGILALGLAQVIVDKGWYKKIFIQKHTAGFEGLKEILNKYYTPDQVSQRTGVPPETMETLAKNFISVERPLALWGKGKGELPVSLFEAQAVHVLNVLAGSIHQPGGVFLQAEFPPPSLTRPGSDITIERGLAQPRLDGALSAQYPNTPHIACNFFENAAQKKPYPINILFLNEINPAFCLGERHFLRAVEQIPFVISFSSIMDESNRFADLILPIPTFLERWDDSTLCRGVPFPVYGLTKPVLPPLYESKPFGEVLLSTAKILGGQVQKALPFETMEEVIKETAKGLFHSQKGRLANGPPPDFGTYHPVPVESFKKFWDQLVTYGTWYHLALKTDAGLGKWDFSSVNFQPPEAREGPREVRKGPEKGDYPYWMIPHSLILLQSGYWPNPPFMTKTLGEDTLIKNHSVVQVHPDTARTLSLREGDLVEMQSVNGKIKARVHLFEGARPNCFFVPLGLGHTGMDPTLNNRGVNPFPILDASPDPLTGLEVAWATRIKIKKMQG